MSEPSAPPPLSNSTAPNREDRWKFAAVAQLRHDLVSDLSAINGLTELMEREIRQRMAGFEADLRVIRERSLSAVNMLAELGDLISGPGGRPLVRLESFDAGELLNDLYAQYGPIAQKRGVTLHCNAHQLDGCLIRCDRRKVRRLLGYLISDVIWQSSGGQRAQILATRQTDGCHVQVQGGPPDTPSPPAKSSPMLEVLSSGPAVGDSSHEFGQPPTDGSATPDATSSFFAADEPQPPRSGRLANRLPIALWLAQLLQLATTRHRLPTGELGYSVVLPVASVQDLDSADAGFQTRR